MTRLVALALVAGCRPTPASEPPRAVAEPVPPVAARESVTTVLHDRTFVDAYAWLRDRDDPRTRAYLDAENAFATATLQPSSALHDTLVAELRARIVADDHSAPLRHGAFDYTTREVSGGEYWIAERTPIAGGPVQIVLDANRRAQAHDYYDVGGYEISPDHRFLAWGEDTSGDERYRVSVIEIATGRAIDSFDDAAGSSMAWSADSRTLWTTRLDTAHREYQLWRRVPGSGTPPVLSYEEKDVRFSVSVQRSRDDRWLQMVLASAVSSEVWVMDAKRPADPWRVIAPRRPGIEYDVEHHGERLFLRTNDGAPEFAIKAAVMTAQGPGTWRPFLAPGADESFTGMHAFADHLVVTGADRACRRSGSIRSTAKPRMRSRGPIRRTRRMSMTTPSSRASRCASATAHR